MCRWLIWGCLRRDTGACFLDLTWLEPEDRKGRRMDAIHSTSLLPVLHLLSVLDRVWLVWGSWMDLAQIPYGHPLLSLWRRLAQAGMLQQEEVWGILLPPSFLNNKETVELLSFGIYICKMVHCTILNGYSINYLGILMDHINSTTLYNMHKCENIFLSHYFHWNHAQAFLLD